MRKQKSVQQSIPEPIAELHSLYTAVLALKEIVEQLAGQRGRALDSAVTWGDLVEAGVIKPEQVPTNVGG